MLLLQGYSQEKMPSVKEEIAYLALGLSSKTTPGIVEDDNGR
jgi:hypothetical protein